MCSKLPHWVLPPQQTVRLSLEIGSALLSHVWFRYQLRNGRAQGEVPNLDPMNPLQLYPKLLCISKFLQTPSYGLDSLRFRCWIFKHCLSLLITFSLVFLGFSFPLKYAIHPSWLSFELKCCGWKWRSESSQQGSRAALPVAPLQWLVVFTAASLGKAQAHVGVT